MVTVGGWVKLEHTYHSKQLPRRLDLGIELACGQLELQRKIPMSPVRNGTRVGRAYAYTIIDPGSVGGRQVFAKAVELHTGHEPRRVLHGLFVRQPSVNSVNSGFGHLVCYIYRRESVVRFATGVDSPGFGGIST
jgi:hypothetical protein